VVSSLARTVLIGAVGLSRIVSRMTAVKIIRVKIVSTLQTSHITFNVFQLREICQLDLSVAENFVDFFMSFSHSFGILSEVVQCKCKQA
jgi:hypothetical protein